MEEKKQIFLDFIKEANILIVDKSSASRRRLVKTFVDFGAKRNQLHSVGHADEAKEVINEIKPKLVISDYHLNGGSGFDLFRMYKEKYPEVESIHILITSNISQAAVAKAAEEDVDAFIIKPYNVSSLEKNLISTVYAKLSPSEYILVIEEGKKELYQEKYEEALVLFEKAISLNPKPSLAYFYHGQAKYFLSLNKEATTDYKTGLSFNHIHYKCQVGLYEIFVKEEKFKEAYEVVRNIARYFPANPNRLAEVIRLSIMTKNYEDINDYYQIFCELEERTENIINHICSGMYVLGKYYFLENEFDKGKEVFEKIAISCQGMTKFLRATISLLIEYGHKEEARLIFKRFPAGTLGKEDHQISSYLVLENETSNAEKINLALNLVNANIHDPQVYKSLLRAMKEEKYEDKIEEFYTFASSKWPSLFFKKDLIQS